jgi:CHASE3 domain sensor protein|tara:strand:- start:464 stop:673 length:210 start_codon:yes stop_codon:yes gene_type:complete
MLKNSAKVFEMAEETAAKFHQRQEAERKAREEAASAIVNSLGDLGEDIVDPLEGVTDQLDSVLESEAKE